ncbi:hypothetical protein B0H19DRAFT_1079177 [Mycena capillaripes]|nr:hypothetical protein B0H19DRAFT_1079177 [Mycena capillaripes]
MCRTLRKGGFASGSESARQGGIWCMNLWRVKCNHSVFTLESGPKAMMLSACSSSRQFTKVMNSSGALRWEEVRDVPGWTREIQQDMKTENGVRRNNENVEVVLEIEGSEEGCGLRGAEVRKAIDEIEDENADNEKQKEGVTEETSDAGQGRTSGRTAAVVRDSGQSVDVAIRVLRPVLRLRRDLSRPGMKSLTTSRR